MINDVRESLSNYNDALTSDILEDFSNEIFLFLERDYWSISSSIHKKDGSTQKCFNINDLNKKCEELLLFYEESIKTEHIDTSSGQTNNSSGPLMDNFNKGNNNFKIDISAASCQTNNVLSPFMDNNK